VLRLDDGSELGDASAVSETIPVCNQYALRRDAFSREIRREIALPQEEEDAVQNIRAIKALFQFV
jgi:hypothetical protein